MENKSSDKLSDICYIKGSRGRWKCIMSHDHSIWGPKQWEKHNIKLYIFLVLLQGCTGKVVYISFWTFTLNTTLHKELTTALKQVKCLIEKWHIFENMKAFCSKKLLTHTKISMALFCEVILKIIKEHLDMNCNGLSHLYDPESTYLQSEIRNFSCICPENFLPDLAQ